MSQSASAPRPERPVARLFELRGRDRREAIEIVQRALSDAGYEPRDCVEVLSPAEAHERLRVEDPELARAIETLAPLLLDRAEARSERDAALAAVTMLLASSDPEAVP